MSKKEIEKLLEAGFISGIYNFCDKWCERCALKLKCMSYVVGKKMEEKLGKTLEESLYTKQETTWIYLKHIFDTTYEILHELAKERGIDMEDIYAAEDMEKGFWPDEFERALQDGKFSKFGETVSQIIQICIIYENLSEVCMEKVFAVLDEKEWALGSPEIRETEDALDKINWYMDVISSKIKKTLLSFYQSQEVDNPEVYEYEYNGSAKVALVAIQISSMAWEVLKKYCPLQVVKDIMHVQVVLEQLERDIETQFPEARKFHRPGFDD